MSPTLPFCRAVRIVVGPQKMTLEGKETTWEKAREELASLPNRADAVLEVAVASDQMTLAQQNEAVSTGMSLAERVEVQNPQRRRGAGVGVEGDDAE